MMVVDSTGLTDTMADREWPPCLASGTIGTRRLRCTAIRVLMHSVAGRRMRFVAAAEAVRACVCALLAQWRGTGVTLYLSATADVEEMAAHGEVDVNRDNRTDGRVRRIDARRAGVLSFCVHVKHANPVQYTVYSCTLYCMY